MQRIGIFGWGIVAPRSPDIKTFAHNLKSAETWLSPFNGFGPDNFLVGVPDFCFEHYKSWIDTRFPPKRFPQLAEKMDPMTLYTVGAFIQSLQQNPGIEKELQELGTQAHVYIGTGLGNLPTIYQASVELHCAQQEWNQFWSDPENNSALRAHNSLPSKKQNPAIPPDPENVPPENQDAARAAWQAYWIEHCPELQHYLNQLANIEAQAVTGDVASEKLNVIKEKQRRKTHLKAEWKAPTPPWEKVSTNLLWNIPNTPAAQVSMLSKITGLSFAPAGACATFGLALKLAIDTIRRNEARAVVIGATDPPPHPLSVGAFYNARVLAAGKEVSKPLTGLRGTHVSGGAVIWIVGDYEYMTSKGYRPLGMEPIAIGVSSDAGHIITPSREGPLAAIHQAIEQAGICPDNIGTWDLHATATPGDYMEIKNLKEALNTNVLVTARKGIFGHGMSAGGGWELTAQYLGYEQGTVFPVPLKPDELNDEITRIHQNFVFDTACKTPDGLAGKLSMGVGGINSCVISRPWN